MGDGQNNEEEAKQALVFMVSCLEGKWKYFLINGLSAEIRKTLIMEAIQRLSEVGTVVVSITLDGPYLNIKTFNLLGKYFVTNVSAKC